MSYNNGWDFGFGWSLKPRWCSQLTEMVWFHISSGTLVLNIKTLAFSTNFLTAIMSSNKETMPSKALEISSTVTLPFFSWLRQRPGPQVWAAPETFRFQEDPKKTRRYSISYQSWLLVSRLKCSRLDLFLCLQVGFLSASRLLLKKTLFKIR